MSLPDRAAPGKPRRLGLYLPFVLAGVIAASWCVLWFILAGQTRQRLDAERDTRNGQGWRIAWDRLDVSGFPFRLDVEISGLRLREPSGWALATRRVKAEAWAYAPDHWIIVAPDALTIARPRGGDLKVTAKVLRASISEFTATPPRLALEGEDLSFAPAPGAKPYFLTAARELDLHARAGPADQGAARLELDGAAPDRASPLGRIAAGKPVDLVIDGIFDHAHALSGADWRSAARAWRDTGGEFRVRAFRLAAGGIEATANSGALTLDSGGRLQGAIDLAIRQPERALAALRDAGVIDAAAARATSIVITATARGADTRTTLDFQAGRMTLGPVAIGPSPRMF